MAVSTKRKNVSKSKSKTSSKSNKVSRSRKHLIKSRKSVTKTRKMRGGGGEKVKWHKKIRDLFSKKKTANSGHSLSKSQNNTEKEDFLKKIIELRKKNHEKRTEAKKKENEYLATLNMNKRIQYESEKARNPYLNSYMSKINKSVSASEELRKLDEELYNKFAIGDKNAAKLEISEQYPEIAKNLGIVIPKKNEVFTATQPNKFMLKRLAIEAEQGKLTNEQEEAIPNETEKPPINETNSEMPEGKKTIKFKINFLNLKEGNYKHYNLIDNQTKYKISVRYNYDTNKTFPEKQLNSIRIDKPGKIIGAGHGAEVPENITMHLVNTYNRVGIDVKTTLENKDEIDVEIELDTQPFTVHYIKLNKMILKPSDELDKDYFTQKFKVVNN